MRKDAKHHGPPVPAHHGALSGHDYTPAHMAEVEPHPIGGDLIEGAAFNWEHFWIDLGGEG